MKIEKDAEAQEAIHSGAPETEPSLMLFNGTRTPSRSRTPPKAGSRIKFHPIAILAI